jgi:uncharacterized membrane protein YhaH (DUF805 family)
MRGTVIGFDAGDNSGAISGHDGKRYDFTRFDWHGQEAPRHGDVVDFVPRGERATDVYRLAPEYVPPTFGQFYFLLRGRISRSQYWLRFLLPVLAVGFVLHLLQSIGVQGARAVSHLFHLLVLWPGIAVLVKRIHDRNKSGALVWFLFGPLLLAFAVTIVAMFRAVVRGGEAGAMGLFAGGIWFLVIGVAIWFFLEFGCMRGSIGPNRFGPDPATDRRA